MKRRSKRRAEKSCIAERKIVFNYVVSVSETLEFCNIGFTNIGD